MHGEVEPKTSKHEVRKNKQQQQQQQQHAVAGAKIDDNPTSQLAHFTFTHTGNEIKEKSEKTMKLPVSDTRTKGKRRRTENQI